MPTFKDIWLSESLVYTPRTGLKLVKYGIVHPSIQGTGDFTAAPKSKGQWATVHPHNPIELAPDMSQNYQKYYQPSDKPSKQHPDKFDPGVTNNTVKTKDFPRLKSFFHKGDIFSHLSPHGDYNAGKWHYHPDVSDLVDTISKHYPKIASQQDAFWKNHKWEVFVPHAAKDSRWRDKSGYHQGRTEEEATI